MVNIKILNLYVGIGGNRKLWPNDKIEVTAIELNPKIAAIYKDFFPNDTVVVGDAHKYLLDHYAEFDFIWASPPCPSHSPIRKVFHNQNKPIYPDMKLYEEILFLRGYFKGKGVVENVISWYKPLILPYKFKHHYYWANFIISGKEKAFRNHYGGVEELSELKGFNISDYGGIDKEKTLRNCVEPLAGLEIFNLAFKEKQKRLI